MTLGFNSATAALLLAAACAAAGAQTVYRCGNTYSQEPCPQGKSIDVDDSRTDAQRASAREVAVRDKALGREMTHDRRVAEADARPPKTHTVKRRRTKEVSLEQPLAKKRARPQTQGEKDFVSIVPKDRSAPKK